jgi:hypothetical protein
VQKKNLGDFATLRETEKHCALCVKKPSRQDAKTLSVEKTLPTSREKPRVLRDIHCALCDTRFLAFYPHHVVRVLTCGCRILAGHHFLLLVV